MKFYLDARLWIVMALVFVSTTAHSETPAILSDLGANTPAPAQYAISQLLTTGEANKPDGLNYYTDNGVNNPAAGEPGQTFTTGNYAFGYTLTSLAIKTGGGTTSGTETPQNYLLNIYSVNGNTNTLLATYSATNFTFADGDWLNWSGFSLSLSSNTVYAYSFGKTSGAVAGWEAMGNADGDLYSGGQLGLIPVAGGPITFGSSHAYDAVFNIGLTTNLNQMIPQVIPMLSNLGTAVPTPGPYDVYQLLTTGEVNMPDGLNYYTDNQPSHNGGEPGQTFTTPGGSAGLLLNTLSIQTGGGTSSGTTTPQSYLLHIYSVNGGTNTLLATFDATNFAFSDGDWLQWSNLNLSLSPSAYYAYSFGKASSTVAGWDQLANADGNLYPGGELGFFPVTGGTITFGSSHDFDGAFDVGLTSTGPPTLAVLTNNPATSILAASATLNGTILSSGGSIPQITVYYGMSNGGTNVGAWSNNIVVGPQLGAFSATVTGLAANKSYFFAAKASNNVGVSWAVPSGSFVTPAVLVPTMTNLPASAIFATSATLSGQVLATGNEFPTATIYFGPTDGGTNPATWANEMSLGVQTGVFSAPVAGLAPSAIYYFTTSASNSAGIGWAASSKTFTTLVLAPAAVTNLSPTGIAAVTATLNGQVLTTGNQAPTVFVYYGTTDGGTNPAAWTNQASIGTQSGAFSASVAGLTANTTYYFTTAASNSAAVAWGAPSLSFTTLNPTRIPVLTYHYDNTRQGQNTNETLLTLANVNVTNFGKLFTYPVDGYVYAQPLIVTNLNVAGKGVRDVLFVATMNDSVYAFDANNNGDTNGGLLWVTNVGVASPSPSTEYGTAYHAVGNLDVVPEEGMAAAPVIDLATGSIYVDAFTREVVAGVSTNYFHRIHALNITNGTEQPYSPVVVAATVPGTGLNGGGTGSPQTTGSKVTFSAIQHMERPALTLAGGILYIAYGSHDDTEPYHGWVFGYNPANLSQVSVFNTTPNGSQGSIWMSGDGLCVDANTNIYFETANGTFDANTNGGDYSQSFVKLSTASNNLAVADYFAPYNEASLSGGDSDVGSGGPLLLPDSVGSTNHPHLIVGAGKEGTIYLVDRDNMGHFNSANDSQIVQELSGAIGGAWSSPAYFNNRIYYNGNGDVMKAFLITNGVIATTPDSESANGIGFPGATPTISANGTNNGIAWVIDDGAYLSSGPAVLHAYNATNLAIELYNSSQNLSRDNPGPAVKMVPPVIAGGKVYVGAQYAVSVFGPAIFLPAPTISPGGGAFIDSVAVTLADATPGASIYYTLDGTMPTTNSTLYTGGLIVTNTVVLQAIAAAPGAVNSAAASASFVNTAAAGSGIGLTGAYYANQTSANPFIGTPDLVETNATINFNWGMVGPTPAVGATNFTVRWTGSIQPQFSQIYTFSTKADGGVRLYLNGQLIINNWVSATNATTQSNTVALVAQQLYSIELDYFQNTNNASVALSWSSPSTPQAIVPETQLYPFTNPPPSVVLTEPVTSSSYTASASVTVSADADATYNPVSIVNFYANASFLGSVTNAPYTLTTTGLAAGSYALTAVAIDGGGLSSTSAPVNITVNTGSGLPYGLTTNSPVSPFFNMPTTFNGSLPLLLSQTGVFANTPAMIPTNGLIPYTPNTPLWSDGALKTRYFAVPNNGGIITPNAQIAFAPTGTWSFPAGTVFVKTFQLNTDTSNPNVLQRLETRLLVRDINGAVYGVTYKWRPDNSDADLLTTSLNEDILITNGTGISTQTWYYPSPSDCLQCHTAVASYVLGINTRQLNGNLTYPATGVTDNQLRTLNQLGLFNPAFNEGSITNMEKLSALTNLTASLQDRSRSYLDANCAQCHQPGGTGITFDARYDTPLADQDITNYSAAVSLGYDHACIIKAQDVWRSVIWDRINTVNKSIQMPPLSRNLVDTNAVQVFTDWINSLPGTLALAPPVITPNGGTYFALVNITLSAPATNAAIYYTLDGSLPTTNSFLYTGAFNLMSNATVSAVAAETNFNNSVADSALFLVQPVYFSSGAFLANQQFQLNLVGVTGKTYVLEATTNLMNWTPISTNTALTNLLNLVDPNATNFTYRFYRVSQQ
jgi:hypothetical protein